MPAVPARSRRASTTPSWPARRAALRGWRSRRGRLLGRYGGCNRRGCPRVQRLRGSRAPRRPALRPMSSQDPQISVQVERRLEEPSESDAPARAPPPQHLPQVPVALPRRRARGLAARLHLLWPSLPGRRARAHPPAVRPRQLSRDGRRHPLGRPARVRGRQAVQRPPRGRRGGDGPRRRDRRRQRHDRGPPVRAGGDGLRLPGRLDGLRGGREVRPRLRPGRRAGRAAGVRRRPRAARACRRTSWRSCRWPRRRSRSTSCRRTRSATSPCSPTRRPAA